MENTPHFLPLAALYAEIHYKFFGFSLISNKLPEVIIDAPYRLESGKALPLLIIAKDADKYPCILMPVTAEIESDEKKEFLKMTDRAENIDKPLWYKIVFYKPDDNVYGKIKINVTITLKRKKKTHTFFNSTYNTGINRPLEVFISPYSLPGSGKALFGDMHTHSSYTSDQVEFGPPIKAIAEMGKAAGLGWSAVTDHSYDLDNIQDNYFKKDPLLLKWKDFRKEVSNINRNGSFTILAGEEVSCGNSKGRNIHLLVINNRDFIPGSGDSAENWLANKPDLSLKTVLDNLDREAVAFAAHPEVKIPFLQKFLLNRNSWTESDYRHEKLTGLQVLNGINDEDFKRGVKSWISLLLKGRKLSIAAGSDSHGFFNRFIHVGTPFISVKEEKGKHIFGQMRTGVLTLKNGLTEDSLLNLVRNGKTVISSGPFLNIIAKGEYSRTAEIGETLNCQVTAINILCQSSPEFGSLKKCIIYFGDIDKKEELIITEISSFDKQYNFIKKINIPSFLSNGYIRGELITEFENEKFICMTNPIYIASHPKK